MAAANTKTQHTKNPEKTHIQLWT